MEEVISNGVRFEGVMHYSRTLGIDWRTLLGLIKSGEIVPDAQLAYDYSPLFSGRNYWEHKKLADRIRRQRHDI